MANESILEEANRLVSTDRQADYGHPIDDFSATASFWRTWIHHKYGVDVPLTAHDVPHMMVLLKESREANAHKRDNMVDAAGYLKTDELVYEEEERRRSTEQRTDR